MGIVLVILITAIVIWKNIYTIILIKKYLNEQNKKHLWLNSIFLINYILYYYFLVAAASGKLASPMQEPVWLIIIFVILTSMNIYYDLKNSKN